jgi:hypothetical protein
MGILVRAPGGLAGTASAVSLPADGMRLDPGAARMIDCNRPIGWRAVRSRQTEQRSLHEALRQAQKWLNMSFKYIYALRLRGFGRLYDLCHVPLDRILIEALGGYGFRPLPCAWSRLNDYDIYLDRQRRVRSRFQLAPLDVEFRLFMGCPPTK